MTSIPINVTAHVVAAGIYNDKARVTVVFSPIVAATDTGLDLVSWPSVIHDLIKQPKLRVVPLKRGQSWRGNLTGADASEIALTRVDKDGTDQIAAITSYWAKLMAGDDGLGFDHLKEALNPNAKDDLVEVLRPKNDAPGKLVAGPKTRINPDIHGSHRGRTAGENLFEHVLHVANRLKGGKSSTRLESNPDNRVMALAQEWQRKAAPLARNGQPLSLAAASDEMEDMQAFTDLHASRDRADAFAEARRTYNTTATSPAAAILALINAMNAHFLGRTATDAALKAGVPDKSLNTDVDMIEALAAFRLASHAPAASPDRSIGLLGEDEDKQQKIDLARRRLFTIQTNPSLGRLFRFVVDFTCDRKAVQDLLKPAGTYDYIDSKLFSNCSFLLLAMAGAPFNGRPVWSSAKWRVPDDVRELDGHFYPCTREEIDARAAYMTAYAFRKMAIAEQIDGMVDLGQAHSFNGKIEKRYEILTIDSVAATAAEYDRVRRRSENRNTLKQYGSTLTPASTEFLETSGDPSLRTHRGGGLALTDRWRQWHAILRHVDSTKQADDFKKAGGEPVLLDACDLTTGYKLDVGVRIKGDTAHRNRWHTLMHRSVEYLPLPAHQSNYVGKFTGGKTLNQYIGSLYPDADARREGDDAQLQIPVALRDNSVASQFLVKDGYQKPYWTSAFTEEIIGTWRGDPIGLACGKEEHKLDREDLLISRIYRLPRRTEPGGPDLVPPRLRFSWRYHFGLRVMFAGGISMPLKHALRHYEYDQDGELVLKPAAQPGEPYLRHERIDAPTITVPDWLFGTLGTATNFVKVALQGRFAAPQAGRMVIRTVKDDSNRATVGAPEPNKEGATPGFGFDRRILLAPSVSLEFATLHGAFDSKAFKDEAKSFETVEMLEPRVPDSDNDELQPGELLGHEFVPVTEPVRLPTIPEVEPGRKALWRKIDIYWRSYKMVSRPRGGLRNVDHRAAWGGFPIYRASLSDGAKRPSEGDFVASPPQAVTNAGEILHRTKGPGEKVRSGKAERTVYWGAQGILPSEDSDVLERAGTAVFRRLPTDRKDDVERIPYYPDPAATTLVVQAIMRDGEMKDGKVTPLLGNAELYASQPVKEPVAKGYPNARPVVLDIVRGSAASISITSSLKYANLPNSGPNPPDITVVRVVVTLAPGQEADVSCWCVPSEVYLAHMCATPTYVATAAVQHGLAQVMEKAAPIETAFQVGMERLMESSLGSFKFNEGDFKEIKPNGEELHFSGYGGLPNPGPKASKMIAQRLRAIMLKMPIPELAAVTRFEAVHAVDVPMVEATGVAGGEFPLLRVTREKMQVVLGDKDPGEPLYDPANWTLENQMAGATSVLLDGTLTIHGPSTSGLEIVAEGVAAARGHFDDVTRGRSRDDRARGLWPKPNGITYMGTKDMFGFKVAPDGTTTFANERVTLLRLEGLAPETKSVDLLSLQREAEKKPEDKKFKLPLRAERPAGFPDARARYIKLFATAVSRHANAMRTRYDELPPVSTLPVPKPLGSFWLAATVRPPRIVPQSPIPSFAWTDSTPVTAGAKLPAVCVTRTALIRIRLKRPWFGSGEGERVGIVIWPPNLFDLAGGDLRKDIVKSLAKGRDPIDLRKLPADVRPSKNPHGEIQDTPYLVDADLGAGGSWVTRWASDPIREMGKVEGWLLSKDNFHDVKIVASLKDEFKEPSEKHTRDALLVDNVLMPVPIDADAAPSVDAEPVGGFMAVSLLTFAPRFDPEQENWYIDVKMDPCGAVYPFVRLGLVRYQPNAPRILQVSEPVVEWAQIMPERTVQAKAEKIKGTLDIRIRATVEGRASQPNPATSKDSTERAPQMHVSLLRRWAPQDGAPLGPETTFDRIQVVEPQCGTNCTMWSTSFVVSAQDYGKPGDSWSIFVEEVDRLRPATYPDEPRYRTHEDDNFTDTGPRFAARLSLDHLHVAN
ncbi:hypothetical protein [Bradyrhizobium sp. AUGA SZCCT0042]|uniref:hypothetical protein n=1 Tax=Bradyrhizobium sp. AUGA SZCCT0042 TaxID=2807651 RepID=UPI001BAD822C|nr:hypothetical protein [Bradyrhizobium sp. AUGA SZCCT0042]MBR1300654.1 hypothetical protein [Bradyrhizobium sp. AUGA SZCCT0042]